MKSKQKALNLGFNNLLTIERGSQTMQIKLPTPFREYIRFRTSTYAQDGVILYHDRILILASLRKNLKSEHAAHRGTASMTSKAMSSIFWPGLSRDIDSVSQNCGDCCRIAPSQPSASPLSVTMAEFPF